MMTRLAGGATTAGVSGAAGAAASCGAADAAATGADGAATAAVGGAAVAAATGGAATGAEATGAAGAGAATTGGRATTGPAGGAAAMAGRGAADAAGTAVTGGRATTGPAGGFAAIAGACGMGVVTKFGPWRGCGTMRRGAGVSALGAATGDAAMGAEATGAAAMGTALATGAAVVAGPAAIGGREAVGGGAAWTRTGGRSTSSLRCWIAFRTSPGLDTRDQSILCAPPLSFLAAEPPLRPFPRCMCARTRCASSISSELECVFGSVTPTSRSTSKIALLLTSSSLAKSLMRTLLIRPFSWHSACRPSAVHSNLLVCGFTCRPFDYRLKTGKSVLRMMKIHAARSPMTSW